MKNNTASVIDFPCAVVDRRMTIERRRFTYANCIPERRSGIDRRCLGAAVYHDGTSAGKTARVKWGSYR